MSYNSRIKSGWKDDEGLFFLLSIYHNENTGNVLTRVALGGTEAKVYWVRKRPKIIHPHRI